MLPPAASPSADPPRRPLVRALLDLLASPRAARLAVLLAVLLTLPALSVGFQLDDHVHRVALGHGTQVEGMPGTRWDLFRFTPGTTAEMTALMRRGVFPYWTLPELRLSFLRPLSTLTHLLDDGLWPERPALMHAQGLLWYASLVFLAARIYRLLFAATPWLVGLAAILYAVDDAHGIPVTWLAHRNALVATTFAFAALYCHLRWRLQNFRPGAVLAPLCLFAGLLGGEAALGVIAYFFACALFLEPPGPLSRRLATLVPAALCAVVWRVVYQVLGYGAYGSGAYLDPVREPLHFLRGVFVRLPLLLSAQLGGPPPDFASFVVALTAPFLLIALVLLGWLVLAARPLLGDPRLRFFAVGSILAALPCCATFPSDRLLLIVGLGGFGLCAVVIGARATLARPGRALVVLLLVLHAVVAPLLLPLRCLSVRLVGAVAVRASRSVPTAPTPVAMVNAPDALTMLQAISVRASAGYPLPTGLRLLGASAREVHVRRPDANTLVVRSEGYLEGPIGELLRGQGHPFRLGERIDLGAWTVTILALTPDQRPLEVEARFPHPLETPSLSWMIFDGAGPRPWTPPPIGGQVVLPPIDPGALFRGP